MSARQHTAPTDDDRTAVTPDDDADVATTAPTDDADINTADLDALDFDADDEDVTDEDEYDADNADNDDIDWADNEDVTDDENDDDAADDTDNDADTQDDDEDDDLDEDNLDWDTDPGDDGFDEEPDTFINDPDILRDMLAKSRRENAARRRKYNEFRDQSVAAIEQGVASFIEQVADQIGITIDDPTDANAVIDAVTELVTGSKEQRTRAERDLAIYRAAIPAGADMAKLADSKSFTAAIDTLDPTSESYAADVAEKLNAHLEANPHYKTAQKIDRSGGDFTGGTPANLPDDSVDALRQKRQQRSGR